MAVAAGFTGLWRFGGAGNSCFARRRRTRRLYVLVVSQAEGSDGHVGHRETWSVARRGSLPVDPGRHGACFQRLRNDRRSRDTFRRGDPRNHRLPCGCPVRGNDWSSEAVGGLAVQRLAEDGLNARIAGRVCTLLEDLRRSGRRLRSSHSHDHAGDVAGPEQQLRTVCHGRSRPGAATTAPDPAAPPTAPHPPSSTPRRCRRAADRQARASPPAAPKSLLRPSVSPPAGRS